MPFLIDVPVSEKAWLPEAGDRDGVPSRRSSPNTPGDAGPWALAIRKIVELRNLGADWDGLGAMAPSPELVESAVQLAYLFSEEGVDPPHCVVPGLDGTVNFEWQNSDGTIAEVEIDRPLHAEVMLIEPGKQPRFWDLPTLKPTNNTGNR